MMSEEEAVDKGVISVTPMSGKPSGNKRRNSTGKSSTQASPSLSADDGKRIPHYLRASTGSCHEFCKYGMTHVFEVKKRLPIRSTFLANSENANENHLVKSPIRRGRKNNQVLKPKQKIDDLPDGHEAIKQKDPLLTIDIPSTLADGSCEELWSNSAVNHATTDLIEGLSEETAVIKLMITPQIVSDEHSPANKAPSEEAMNIQLDSTSPTLVNPAFSENTPFSWDSPECAHCSWIEESMEEPVSSGAMNSCTLQETIPCDEHTPSSPAERLASPKLKATSSVQGSITSAGYGFIDQTVGSSASLIRATKKTVLPVRRSIIYGRQTPDIRAEKTVESAKMKLNGLSPGGMKISSTKHVQANQREESSKEQNQHMSISSVDRKKRAVPKIMPKKDKIDASADLDIVNRSTLLPAKKGLTSLFSTKNTVSSGTPKIIKQKASSPPKRIYATVKPISPLNSSGSNDQKGLDNKIMCRLVSSKSGEKKILKPSKICPSPQPVSGSPSIKLKKLRSVKLASPLKAQVKTANREYSGELVKEKILHVIDPKKFSTSSGSKSVFKVSRGKKPADVSKGDGVLRSRRTATLPSEDKPPSPHKLNFRRGKIVSLQAAESNGPRRLRFRQPRAVDDKRSEIGSTRGFRKRRGSTGADYPPGIEGQAVVLRHQDVQDKKDHQGLLYNYVIEETASRLVQARKSRVKALVCAFETVISLQESKVALHAHSFDYCCILFNNSEVSTSLNITSIKIMNNTIYSRCLLHPQTACWSIELNQVPIHSHSTPLYSLSLPFLVHIFKLAPTHHHSKQKSHLEGEYPTLGC